MSQVYSVAADSSAKVVFQIADPQGAISDRPQALADLHTFLETQTRVPIQALAYLADPTDSTQRGGIQATLRGEYVSPLLQEVSQRLREAPVSLMVLIALGTVRLQGRSRQGEELLALLPAVDALLPARQIFQAQAEAYALRGGEHSPVAQANLELLRHRLNLSLEEADTIIARSLGPYIDRQTKLQKYREVLSAEIERSHPLSEATWGELRQLYQNLGLSYEDVSPIDQEYVTRIQAEVTRLQQSDLETRMAASQQQEAETTLAPEALPEEDYQELYRQEFRDAIAQSLYPNEFDRGRLEQARRFWHLSSDTVQAIEQEETAARYGPTDSERNLDYTRLRQLLWAQHWQEADQETERLILSALSQDMRPITASILITFPCVDMQTLDALWARYSEGRFGFRAQYQCYQSQSRRAKEFLDAIAWRNAPGIGVVTTLSLSKSYQDLQFQLAAPTGHLPTWRWGCTTLDSRYDIPEGLVDALFLRVEKCLPGAIALPEISPESPASDTP